MDHSDSVIKWNYEAIKIPYFNIIDKKEHNYYPDFYVELNDKKGILKKYIVEVKPESQTVPPKQPKRTSKRYIYEAHEFIKNQCKWEAVKIFCEKRGLEFKLITENELFPK